VSPGNGQGATLGMARVLVGIAALVKASIVIPVLSELSDPTAIRLPLASWIPALSHVFIPVVVGVWLVAAIAFLVGWQTVWAGSALLAALATVLVGDQQLYSNHLYLLATVVGLLTLAGAGRELSLDARGADKPSRSPGCAVVLLKLQVSIVYGFTALAKVNLTFLSGAVLGAVLGRNSLLPFPDAARTFTVMASLSWGAILVEMFLAAAFWSQRWRPVAVVAGVLFHLSIVLFVGPVLELVVFALIMFALYLIHLGDPLTTGTTAREASFP
jgi:hypothetical protein